MKLVTMPVARTFSVFSPIEYTVVGMSRIAALGALLLTGVMCSAQDDLARLIPPDAPVLAGMRRSSTDNEYDRMWLATARNLNDLKDFITLTDADASRRFDRVLVAASPAGNDLLGDHLLIAAGHFDWSVISQSTAFAAGDFHGVPIIVRDQASSAGAETRWLVNLHSRIVLFGSPSACLAPNPCNQSDSISKADILWIRQRRSVSDDDSCTTPSRRLLKAAAALDRGGPSPRLQRC